MRIKGLIVGAAVVLLAVVLAEPVYLMTRGQPAAGRECLTLRGNVARSIVVEERILAPGQFNLGGLYSQPYAFQVGGAVREEALLEALAAKLAPRLAELLAREGLGGEAGTAAAGSQKYDNQVRQLFEAKCVNCHGEGREEGRVDLRNPAALSEAEGWEAFRRTYTGNMPKNATALADEEVEVLQLWNVYRHELAE